jgi:hypothetical protein
MSAGNRQKASFKMPLSQQRDERICIATKVGWIGSHVGDAQKLSEALKNLGLVFDAPLTRRLNWSLRVQKE